MNTNYPLRHELKTAALAAAARGWRVFPLKPGTITPAVQNWQQKATTDTEKINTAWDHGPYNVGLAPCPSGLLVLDLVPASPGEHPPLCHRSPGIQDGADVLAALTDSKGARFPVETFSVITPGRGLHLYFAHPQGHCPRASVGTDSPLGWHVAIRSAGSFVPLPASITSQGTYEIAHPGPVGAWPDYLARHLPASALSPTCPGARAAHQVQQEALPIG
ncbi:bifunctional DNA primase/polymerase [Streptomyces sp. NPDC051644]|uniref:bifunctional DNA primase/polymerase n=1 Tax=Streptomyces sp. NPDC051644 TaxID=3365666 RepID=UPI0037962315